MNRSRSLSLSITSCSRILLNLLPIIANSTICWTDTESRSVLVNLLSTRSDICWWTYYPDSPVKKPAARASLRRRPPPVHCIEPHHAHCIIFFSFWDRNNKLITRTYRTGFIVNILFSCFVMKFPNNDLNHDSLAQCNQSCPRDFSTMEGLFGNVFLFYWFSPLISLKRSCKT